VGQVLGDIMNCGFYAGYTLADIMGCTLYNLGIPFDIAALFIIAGFVLLALMARLNFDFALGVSLILSYSLLFLSGNASYMLTVITTILTIGAGIRVFMGILAILRQ